ncbi:MAG: hypothetical protein AABZ55_02380 [Bdellovibrionota bacterium]
MSDHASDRFFRAGQYDQAAESLRHGLEEQGESGRDQLLYLLDLGLTLHTAGKFEESNQVFLKADKIAEIKDYTSLAAETATLLTSDNIKDYKGEDFENVMISTYLAMNYALMGDYENSLVEARRVNRKLHLMVTEGERKYKQNAFARYLSGVIYEAERNYNDAYVDYKKTYELEPSFRSLGRDLWRMAALIGIQEDMERWDREFNLSEEDHRSARDLFPKKGKGEVVVFYQNGISPRKVPNPQFHELPIFIPRSNPVSYAQVTAIREGSGVGQSVGTGRLHDVEATAIENLQEKYAGLVAKKIAGIVAKEIVSDQIAKKTDSPLLGFAAKMFFYASDQADVRSWNLLPKDLQVARLTVDPGTYVVRVEPVGGGGATEKTLQVKAGKKVFVNFRYIPH